MKARQIKGRSFTLIELLVVVAIIALLISILLPALGKAKEQGRLAVCLSNLHHLALAFEQYFNDNGHILPEAAQKPSLNPEDPEEDGYYIPITELMADYAKNQQLFHCPSDLPGKVKRDAENRGLSYWETEGTSYEYNFVPWMAAEFLEGTGLKLKIDVGDTEVKWNLPIPIPDAFQKWFDVRTSDIYMLFDFGPFHGERGKNEIRPTLYADCHVEEYFRLPWGADPNLMDPNYIDPNLL